MNENEIELATQLAESVKEFFQDEDGDSLPLDVDVEVAFADGAAKLEWEFVEDVDDEEGDEDE